MEKNLFERHQALTEKGIIIMVNATNQISNGYEKQVNEGSMPLITFTVEVMDEKLEDMFYTISCDTFEEALTEGIQYAEQHL